MQIDVANASIKHLNELSDIEKKCFGKEAFTKRQIAQLLGTYNSIGLIARENGRSIGYVIGSVDVANGLLVGHILTLDVLPTYRHQGMGLRLLQEIEGIFRDKNARTCYLEVREDNAEALRLYERSGYKRRARLENYYGDAHGLMLEKDLT